MSEGKDDRRTKLERLRAEGIDPFPHQFGGVVPVEQIHAAHGNLEPGEESGQTYRVAGRLSARRTVIAEAVPKSHHFRANRYKLL